MYDFLHCINLSVKFTIALIYGCTILRNVQQSVGDGKVRRAQSCRIVRGTMVAWTSRSMSRKCWQLGCAPLACTIARRSQYRVTGVSCFVFSTVQPALQMSSNEIDAGLSSTKRMCDETATTLGTVKCRNLRDVS